MANQSIHLKNLVFITGAAKSGKSLLAEKIARRGNSNVFYLATMPELKNDQELNYKLNEHKKRRPDDWQTIEKQLAIHEEIDRFKNENSICIIDCLSLYVSNIMLEKTRTYDYQSQTENLKNQIEFLIETIKKQDKVQFILVTNEVGWSVVPENKSARIYRELLGIANQKLAACADQVYLCVSGVTIKIKADNIDVFNPA